MTSRPGSSAGHRRPARGATDTVPGRADDGGDPAPGRVPAGADRRRRGGLRSHLQPARARVLHALLGSPHHRERPDPPSDRAHCSFGVFGPGYRANATIGRALRLLMINIGGATPGQTSMSTFGHPSRYTYCIGEHEEARPWPAYHVERGIDAAASAVTLFAQPRRRTSRSSSSRHRRKFTSPSRAARRTAFRWPCQAGWDEERLTPRYQHRRNRLTSPKDRANMSRFFSSKRMRR